MQIIETARPMTNASATITTELSYWCSYLGLAGQQLTLRPDLHIVAASLHYDDRYFVEVDYDTENPARVLTVCQRYVTYYASGAKQRVCGVFPLVLWAVSNATRCQQLCRVIASDQRLPAVPFAVITNQQIGEAMRNGVAA